MKVNSKKGFTLLEIIIVVIILGVLASLALPKLFGTVEFSRASESLNVMGSLRDSLGRCILSTGASASCSTSELDMADPDKTGGTHFTYSVTGLDTAGAMTITATRNTIDGGTAGDKVILTVSSTGVTRFGSSKFVGVK
ncbi:MAG: prepilin-type N-terminal cleavage/methylation domain-containing protein [Candidatus Omnitrophica bacterium]|nr:prepilin-type N-terminal cleavage/methylation domain-containing protein [Candidatus Omnitrophota bacterium]